MVKMYMVICILMSSWLVVGKCRSTPPAGDCSNQVMDMEDCIQYLSKGGKQTEPTASCCEGISKVLKSKPNCVCETLKSSAQMGVDVNRTRAVTIASDCKISNPPNVDNCLPSSSGANSSKGGASSSSSSSSNSPQEQEVPPPPTSRAEDQSVTACLFASISMLLLAVSFSYMSL